MSKNTQPIKRFFLFDSFSLNNKVQVLSSFTLSFTFKADKLTSPKFTPLYTQLSTEPSAGIVGQSLLSLSFKVLFNSDLTTFWTGALASFIVISIAALVHTIVKTYIGYLNRRSPLQFLPNFAGVYSLWLFYYLLFMTGYWFLFNKTTSSPFLLLPPEDTTLYPAFYSLVGVMVLFRLAWAFR